MRLWHLAIACRQMDLVADGDKVVKAWRVADS